GGGWVLDVDIRKFFDTLDHAQLRALMRRRVRDGVLLRLIDKWLSAGVLDEWFEQVVKPRLRGKAFLISYADDFIMAFACESDARRVLEVLPKRFSKFGLTIHPEKTRLVRFVRPP